MTSQDTSYKRLCAIIDELNEVLSKMDDVGPTFVEAYIAIRDADFDEEEPPPMTDEELSEAKAECDRNADEMTRLENRIDELREEYFSIRGCYPFFRTWPTSAKFELDHDGAPSWVIDR